jgi:uncharacterized protein YceK
LKKIALFTFLLIALLLSGCGDEVKEGNPKGSIENIEKKTNTTKKNKQEPTNTNAKSLSPDEKWSFQDWENASDELKLQKIARVFEYANLPVKADTYLEEVSKVVDSFLEEAKTKENWTIEDEIAISHDYMSRKLESQKHSYVWIF